jgi:hypothetical protein
MTIDQQLRDRFDRATEGPLPTPDLAAAIAGGRRRRRLRATSYAVGSLAVAAVAASAIVVPRLDGPERVIVAGPTSEVDYVPGTTIDTDLAAAVAAADASLPAPIDVYPFDVSRNAQLSDERFAEANEWELVYDLAPGVDLMVQVSKRVPGDGVVPECPAATSCARSWILAGSPDHEAADAKLWFYTRFVAIDGHFVTVTERTESVASESGGPSDELRVLTDEQSKAIAQAPGLDFPDPVEPAPAP